MLCKICVVQIQPRKHALDGAAYQRLPPGYNRNFIQIINISALLADVDHQVGIDYLPKVGTILSRAKVCAPLEGGRAQQERTSV